ncbi:hypothetical protein DCS_06849 [Drechmeria coniospora]|uniref:Peroxisomal membrane protein PEX14 n=1 Tax=Drechmeria coniospora TaxID=98403 RepID=A0A151GCQ8_DRECN|nr:hypothetical protein DCS_06849 [Drechmeria coniospora]KYK54888.1 hypothetical protein DCS_06849 [Drechmeria coniospora]
MQAQVQPPAKSPDEAQLTCLFASSSSTNEPESAMAIREDLVASADPSVASSTVENKITFLRSKNLTQEEIDASLARASGQAPPPAGQYAGGPSGPPQQYFQPHPQYGWQPQPLPPRRDWRDWFIMATVVSGVGYGLYTLGKRYVYPLVAPPTPERIEQDKKSIEEQFDKAFGLVEQLAQDTEALKAAEEQRTARLDTAIGDLETVMSELKAANRRREDEAQRMRDEVQALKDAIPKAMENQKDVTDKRLSEINTELSSLKTLVSQRMASNAAPATSSSLLRPSSNGTANRTPTPTVESGSEPAGTPSAETAKLATKTTPLHRPINGGSGKASIPAWQMAAANKGAAANKSEANGVEGEASGSQEASSSS